MRHDKNHQGRDQRGSRTSRRTTVVVLDVKKMTSMFDKVIVASAGFGRQSKGAFQEPAGKAQAIGAKVYGVEGEQTGEWVLVDLGSVVVHIMQPRDPPVLQSRGAVVAARKLNRGAARQKATA